ncbi:unnamed protein product [Schistosoma margrebowiei]|uniref:Uncharacterized protein n=1 Tax=Schistosoma margrebowiei TaxID=48269 RepID=A0A183MQ12_9TREM|nr:unnamed protein product [Schistosoma margrebowiei]
MVPTLLLAVCFVETVFGLEAKEAKLMLEVHNEHRGYRKKCDQTDIVPAEELLRPLEWNNELEAAAQLWSQNCDAYDDEPVGSVGKFDSVGRNTAVSSELAEAVTYWMEESDRYDHKSDQCDIPHQCDSYKQIVQADTAYVGCGYSRCEGVGNLNEKLITCFYSPACIYMTAALTKTRYQRMVPTILLAVCFVEAVFGLNAEEAQLMLKVHNEQRKYRSKYDETDIVPAEAILQPLEWNDELEAAAQNWSQKCDAYDEEPVGSVGKFDSVGRNTAISSEMAEAVTYWMEESVHYDHKSDHCKPPHQCDSYKQIVQAETAYVGCGYTECPGYEFPANKLIACFYSPAVIKRQPYTDENNCGCKNVTEGQNGINEKKKKEEQKKEYAKSKMEKKEEKKDEGKEKKKTEKKRKLGEN